MLHGMQLLADWKCAFRALGTSITDVMERRSSTHCTAVSGPIFSIPCRTRFTVGGGVRSVCDKVYALNRALSSADLYYEVELPNIFTFDHPLGAVMGRAKYSDYFTFSQGCTVGNNHGIYPRFGRRVFMMSDSKVIGDCKVGDNVVIAANAYVRDQDIPGNSLVFGASPNLIIKERHKVSVDAYAEGVFVYE